MPFDNLTHIEAYEAELPQSSTSTLRKQNPLDRFLSVQTLAFGVGQYALYFQYLPDTMRSIRIRGTSQALAMVAAKGI